MDALRRTCAVLLSAAMLVAGVGVGAQPVDGGAAATFEEALYNADNAWVYGSFDEVIAALRPWMLPAPPPVSETVLLRAWERLGASAWYEGDEELASIAFLELLRLDSQARLDPFVHPNLLVRFFDNVRSENAAELALDTPGVAGGETVYIERSVQTQSILVSMLPFGWGFFAADRDGLATTYLITEVALGATSAGLYWANEAQRGPDGLYDDATVPERRRRIQTITGWSFFALVATNMVHGALAHRSITSVEYRTLTEPPSELRDPESSAAPPRRWAIRFAPIF